MEEIKKMLSLKKSEKFAGVKGPLVTIVMDGIGFGTDGEENAVKNAKVPVCFIHGKTDDFVPAYMSEENYSACKTEKDLLLIDGAGHGLAYIIAPDDYIETLASFDKKIGL